MFVRGPGFFCCCCCFFFFKLPIIFSLLCPSEVSKTHFNLFFCKGLKLSVYCQGLIFQMAAFLKQKVSGDLCCNFVNRTSEMLEYFYILQTLRYQYIGNFSNMLIHTEDDLQSRHLCMFMKIFKIFTWTLRRRQRSSVKLWQQPHLLKLIEKCVCLSGRNH